MYSISFTGGKWEFCNSGHEEPKIKKQKKKCPRVRNYSPIKFSNRTLIRIIEREKRSNVKAALGVLSVAITLDI